MGAGIAADPLSPDFDPLGASGEAPAPSGFGGMLHPRRERHQASHSVTGAGRDTLAGLNAATSGGQLDDRAETRLPRLGPYHRTSLPPVAGRRASSLHGQRLSVSRGRGKTPGTPSLADPPGHRLRGGGLPCAVRYSASILDGFLAAPFHDIGISDWCFCDFSLPHHPLTRWMLSLNPSREKREMAAAGCG